MSGRERFFFSFALLLSLVIHATLAWGVMDLRLAATPRSVLFEPPQREVDRGAVSVRRAAEDLIVSDAPDEPEPFEPDLAADDSEALDRQAQRLLENLDLSDTFEAEDDPAALDETADEGLAMDEPTHLDAAPPVPGPAAAVDATGQLLAAADPTVSLPEFVAAEGDLPPLAGDDEPAVADADGLPGLDAAELRELDDLLGGDLDADADAALGTGGGAGFGGGDGPDPLAALTGDLTGPLTGFGGLPGEPGPTARDSGAEAAPGVGVGSAGVGPPRLSGADLVGVPDLARTLLRAPRGDDGDELAVLHLDDDFTYQLRVAHEFPRPRGLFDVLGIRDLGDERSWFEVRIEPEQSLRRLEPLNKDVVWAIDTSASVSQWYVDQMRRGVEQSLRTLNEGDRFNIVLFDDEVHPLSEAGLLEANDENLERARAFLAEARAGGRSDVHRALSSLLVRDVPPDRVYQIILLSDGVRTRRSVSARNIVDLITRENDRVAGIYAVGVGPEPDRHLLDLLAYRNKGRVSYPDRPEGTAAAIVELAGRLRYPVVRDATFSAAGVDQRSMHPQTPRHIYMGEPLSLFGRFSDDARRLSMHISGTNRERELDLTFTLDFRRAAAGAPQLPRNWAFWKLHDLHRQLSREGDSADLQDRINYLRQRYNLDTPY